jgi:hypothetical protein
VIFGEPIDLKTATTNTRARAAAADVTEKVEHGIRELMKQKA